MEILLVLTLILNLFVDSILVFFFVSAANKTDASPDSGVETQSSDSFFHAQYNDILTDFAELVQEKVQKERIELELKNARAVQKDLNRKIFSDSDLLESDGNIMTADTCSGDWWFSFHTKSFGYYWVGDVVGHGVSSALTAASCRAILTSMTEDSNTDIVQQADRLNKSLCSMFNGAHYSTFVAIEVELETGEGKMINGSHPDPILLNANKSSFLESEVLYASLGSSKKSRYEAHSFMIPPGHGLLAYSDGLIELDTQPGVRWSERVILKTLSDIFEKTKGVPELVNQKIADKVYGISVNKEILKDDITVLTLFRP